ncbi:MAG: helicase-related protein, partial [Planctomycetota bacterium]
ADRGFEPRWMPDFLFPFQRALVEWATRKGRGGLLQTLREAEKFGVDCRRSAGEVKADARVIVTNYEKLSHFIPSDFSGVVCDESSAIKAFDGKRRAEVTEFMRTVPYRLLCTATAAPNDYIELGTASEALGELGQMDMLGRFFRNDQNTSDMRKKWRGQGGTGGGWRFKGHAERGFWQWVCSWARACRRPSDLGFEDDGFVLPALIEREHIVETRTVAPGMLFPLPATNMWEEREERRRTIRERCEMAAAEGDLLGRMIRDGRQVSGSQSDEQKEEAYEAFSSGQLRVLIIKPKIGAWGLNWQHCAHVVTFASHSYEQYYQAVRRCWRFGQDRRVTVDLVATEGERGIKENLHRKSEAADRMFTELVAHMGDALRLDRGPQFEHSVEAPAWL